MNLTKLAVAMAAALFAGQAFSAPITPATILDASNNGTLQQAWISGASAPTYNVFLGFANGCDADTLAVFHNNSNVATALRPGSAGNFNAYACTRAGVVSVLYHTVDGGSFNAYTPHLFGTALQRLRNISANTTCAQVPLNATIANPADPNGPRIPAGFLVAPNQSQVPVYGACGRGVGNALADNAPTLPAGGFSDVEAALFGADISAIGTEADANVGQAFGVAVSTQLYRALQQQQGIANRTDASDPDFSPANAPTISSAQYAAIATGRHRTWGALLPAVAGSNTFQMRLARRADTSGTQRSSNAFFLKNPCNGDPVIAGALAPSAAQQTPPANPTFFVTADSSTGDAKKRFKNSTPAVTDDYVIGVLSLENDWRVDPNTDNGYRYVKLDNVHPEAPVAGSSAVYDVNARNTAANGEYGYHMELKAFTANTAVGTFGETVIGEIISGFGALPCTEVPRGLTLLQGAGSSCVAGQQVAKVTRSGNNCQPSVLNR